MYQDEGTWSRSELLVAKPKEKITISQWADEKRILTNAAIKGQYQSKHVPGLIPIMNYCVEHPQVEEIALCKSAQIGGTDGVINIIGYFVDQDPSSIMLVLADEDTAIQEMSRRRIQPMFTDSPKLNTLPDKDNWLKDDLGFINGARVSLGWASSVGRLASRPFRIVICDEIDKPGYDIQTKEGDAVGLAKERTNTFDNRIVFLLSTPTLTTGRITTELLSCEVIFDLHVPCPHCGQFQPLRWSMKHTYGFKDGKYRGDDGKMHPFGYVVWEGGREATRKQIQKARYKCGECGGLWTNVQKNNAVQAAKLVPRGEHTGDEIKVGFHINRLYSLFPGGRLEKMVNDWIHAVRSGDHLQIQGFVNSTLGEPFQQVTITTDGGKIIKARVDLEPKTVPEGTLCLTCGIDNQRVGFWYVVRAWADGFTSWLIDYGFLHEWADVENLLFETAYPDAQNNQYRIWRAGIDTGGGKFEEGGGISMTEEVYFWLRQNGVGRGCRVWGTKGASKDTGKKISAGKPLDKTPSGKPLLGGLQVVTLNTDILKDSYHYRLEQAIKQEIIQAAFLHKGVGNDYFKQIQAEEKQIDRKGKETWVQTKPNNHLLDCEVICHSLVDPEWPGGGLNLIRRPATTNPKPKKEKKKSENPYTGGGPVNYR